ncbi:hypothetical protein C8Q75DRAFT_733960 [Abortiporus biennis]|nr:hypothetical protein C8Q75DRAFT_733960 [Abortiporus biennis]
MEVIGAVDERDGDNELDAVELTVLGMPDEKDETAEDETVDALEDGIEKDEFAELWAEAIELRIELVAEPIRTGAYQVKMATPLYEKMLEGLPLNRLRGLDYQGDWRYKYAAICCDNPKDGASRGELKEKHSYSKTLRIIPQNLDLQWDSSNPRNHFRTDRDDPSRSYPRDEFSLCRIPTEPMILRSHKDSTFAECKRRDFQPLNWNLSSPFAMSSTNPGIYNGYRSWRRRETLQKT